MAELPEPSVKYVVLISGPIASGKTTLSRFLELRCGFFVVSTRELLSSLARDRRGLQAAGASLDESTAGMWVRDGLLGLRSRSPAQASFVVDSVRTLDQVKWLRETFGASVKHVHLTASPEVLSSRYHSRSEGHRYQDVVADPVERRVGLLASSADLVVDTGCLGPDLIVERVADHLALGS